MLTSRGGRQTPRLTKILSLCRWLLEQKAPGRLSKERGRDAGGDPEVQRVSRCRQPRHGHCGVSAPGSVSGAGREGSSVMRGRPVQGRAQGLEMGNEAQLLTSRGGTGGARQRGSSSPLLRERRVFLSLCTYSK